MIVQVKATEDISSLSAKKHVPYQTSVGVWVVLQIWFSEGDFNFTAEMVQKAAEAKLLRKAQRQAAMDAAKMAKRERG